MTTKIHLELTVDQATAVSDALDVYSRLCIGQLEEVAKMVQDGRIKARGSKRQPDEYVEAENAVCEDVLAMLDRAKSILGYSKGASMGIGNKSVSDTAARAWEVKKTMDKILAEIRNPNPVFRGVDYDGLVVRYTNDPNPVVTAIETKGN